MPLIDTTGDPADAGAVPTRNLYPDNTSLNQALDEAVAWLSRKGRLSSDVVPRLIPIPGVTDDGPWHTSLSYIAPAYSTNEVRRVAWIPNGGQETQLIPDSRENMDRTRTSYMTQTPGTPQRYWTEGGSLLLWPAPQTTGILSLMLGKAMWSQAQEIDQEQVDILPSDYNPLVTLKATSLITSQQPEDQLMVVLKAAVDSELADGLLDFLAWARRQNRSLQPKMIAKTGRVPMFSGRR